MSTICPEKINLLSIKIFKSSIHTTEEYMNHPVKPDGVEIQVGQNTAFNFEVKNIRVRLHVGLTATNNEKQPIGLHGDYVLEFIIHVENLDEFVVEKEGSRVVDRILGGTINGIVYSTARGIIFERTATSSFGGVVLPVIDPKQLIEQA